jgi:uncharacterized OB-fold protein
MSAGAVSRDVHSAEFFDGTARGEFLLRRCQQCATFAEPYALQCPRCESTALEWVPAAGGGRVVSWSVVHGRPDADGVVPRSVVAIAELDEGPWWWAEIVDVDPDTVHAGQRLRISIEPVDGYEAVPVLRAG